MFDWYFDQFDEHPFLTLVGTGLVVVLLIWLFVHLGGCGSVNYEHAVVAGKVYTPSSTHIVSTGKTTGVAYSAEQYTLILKFDDGHAESTNVVADIYVVLKEGDEVRADARWWGVAEVKRP